jgi:hypothetical protein
MADRLGFCDVPSVSGNLFGPEFAIALAKALLVNGRLTSLNLSYNHLCGHDNRGTYTAEGITAIAGAMRVNGALTHVDVRQNNIAGDGAAHLAAAVLGNLKIEMFNEIPIKQMRANSLTELDLNGKEVGVEGGMVVAGLIPIMGALTVTNLLGNQLDEASAKMLAEVAKQKGISLCGIQRDQTTADFSKQYLNPPNAILLASDLSQAVVTGALTSCHSRIQVSLDGYALPIKKLKGTEPVESLDLSKKGLGVASAIVIASLIGVNGSLTQVLAFCSPSHPFSVI